MKADQGSFQGGGTIPSSPQEATRELHANLRADIRSDAQFITAALSWYDGGPASDDVRGAWERICAALPTAGEPTIAVGDLSGVAYGGGRHKFKPNTSYPQFCDVCGYGPGERLQHPQDHILGERG